MCDVHCARASTIIWFVATLVYKDARRPPTGPRLYRGRQNTPRLSILLICRRLTLYYLLLCFIRVVPLIYPSASRASSAGADSSPQEGFKLCGHRLRDSDIAQSMMVDDANLECTRCPRRCAEKHTFRKKKGTSCIRCTQQEDGGLEEAARRTFLTLMHVFFLARLGEV